MKQGTLRAFAENIFQSGELTEQDLLKLRRLIGRDFKIDREEAELLFQINDSLKTPDSWSGYFIMVLTTYLIDEGTPQGYVSEEQAAWLRKRIDHDGVVETLTELGLLLNLIKQANNVTDSLEKFALSQVGQAVLSGRGYVGRNLSLKPGVIGSAEIEILRKVLYGMSSQGGISISRMEAEFLFDLNEATLAKDNHEDWQQLFVNGIANHLMMLAAYEEPDIQEAIRREDWLNDKSRMLRISNINFKNLAYARDYFFGKETDTQPLTNMNEAATAHAEKITLSEADWLIERLNRDQRLDANEQALLTFLSEECPNIHASLVNVIKAA